MTDAVIVMDLDETVLDNSIYQEQLHKNHRFHTPSWNNLSN